MADRKERSSFQIYEMKSIKSIAGRYLKRFEPKYFLTIEIDTYKNQSLLTLMDHNPTLIR